MMPRIRNRQQIGAAIRQRQRLGAASPELRHIAKLSLCLRSLGRVNLYPGDRIRARFGELPREGPCSSTHVNDMLA